MLDVVVVVPVLDRPHRVPLLADSFRRNTDTSKASLLWVVDAHDHDEHAAIAVQGAESSCLIHGGSYASKVNAAYRATDEPWLFLAADDVEFQPRWVDAAMRAAKQYGAGVVGTNDLANPRVMSGRHSTHSFVARWYADQHGTIDGDGILHEGFLHNFCDDEMVATAKRRRLYTWAKESHVKHLHPNFDKTVERDATYEKGQSTFDTDRALFMSRRRLWL